MKAAMMTQHPILFVDDDVDFLTDMRAKCTAASVLSIEVCSAAAALETVKSVKVCAVCIDLKLGQRCGLTLVEDIKRHDPELTIVVVSQYRSLKSAVAALKLGAVDYLPKPLEVEDLLRAINSSENHQRYLDEVMAELAADGPTSLGDPVSLELIENEHIRKIMSRERNVAEAARILRVHRTTLFRKRHVWEDVLDSGAIAQA